MPKEMDGMDVALTPDLARGLARLARLELSLERAADVARGLAPIMAGDARIAALDLGTLSPIGPSWLEPSDD